MTARVSKGWGKHVTPYERGSKRKPKFSNVRVEVDGIKFDSAKEARRYQSLKMLLRLGEIRNLRLQLRYPLHVNGTLVAHYVADFDYEERVDPTAPAPGEIAPPAAVEWRPVTEDVKGGEATQTDTFKLKAKMFAAEYGRKVRIT